MAKLEYDIAIGAHPFKYYENHRGNRKSVVIQYWSGGYYYDSFEAPSEGHSFHKTLEDRIKFVKKGVRFRWPSGEPDHVFVTESTYRLIAKNKYGLYIDNDR